MSGIFYLLFFSLLCCIFPIKIEAIVFLPAVILIPIAKIVAVVLLGISFPAVSIGAMVSKISGISFKKMLGIIVVLLVIFTAAIVLFLKLHNPQRPFF